ncbi:MAG: hypothetical protein IKB80_02940 [Oscillospiraceae bacterium]|nr:hypothetical protein [Oscillospiraceae bacterium]
MGFEDFIYGGSAFVSGMLMVALIFIVVIFIAVAIPVASYVLHSLGLYTIAKRRGLRHKWLAWLPFGEAWLLGSISDQYQYVAKGKIQYRRRWLLLLYIAAVAIYLGCLGTLVSSMLFSDYIAAVIAHTMGGRLALIAVLIAFGILRYIAYYNLFRSCQPSNALLYLLLSILVPVSMPFIVFFIRKMDQGMPPRKQTPVVEVLAEEVEDIPEEAVEEIAEEITEE